MIVNHARNLGIGTPPIQDDDYEKGSKKLFSLVSEFAEIDFR